MGKRRGSERPGPIVEDVPHVLPSESHIASAVVPRSHEAMGAVLDLDPPKGYNPSVNSKTKKLLLLLVAPLSVLATVVFTGLRDLGAGLPRAVWGLLLIAVSPLIALGFLGYLIVRLAQGFSVEEAMAVEGSQESREDPGEALEVEVDSASEVGRALRRAGIREVWSVSSARMSRGSGRRYRRG
jgi:hypothetical protein